MISYRKEIDGLRALAVVPVIIFHSGLGLLPGGFIGVDIFFVISGYLITLILLHEMSSGTFSFARFYERRARRILPALVVMMLSCIPFAWMWMLASDLKDFFQSLGAAALSLSNVLFWREADYFARSAELKPLLHTWSLAVEEQFYILYPPILLLAFRRTRAALPFLIGLVSLVSLLAAQLLIDTETTAVFYLLPFRAWELFAGVFCGWWHFTHGRREDGWAAGLGLALILAPVVLYDSTTTFPGMTAVPPVLGAMLITLFAGQGNLVGRFLSLPSNVGIGLISYSLYLWHQPIFALLRHYAIEPTTSMTVFALLLTLCIGWASWAFVERPFRRGGPGTLLPTRRGVFALGVAASVPILAMSAAGHIRDGFPGRYTPEQNEMLAQSAWDRRCLHTRLYLLESLPDVPCTFGPIAVSEAAPAGVAETPRPATAGEPGSRPPLGRVALVGDSVMASLSPALIEYFTAKGYQVDQFTHSYCFFSRRYTYDNQDARPCAALMGKVLDWLEQQPYSVLVHLSDYDQYLQGARYPIYDSVTGKRASPEEVIRDVRAAAGEFGDRIVFLRLYPRARDHVPNRILKELRTSGHVSPQRYDPENRPMPEVDDRIATMMAGFRTISLEHAFCDAAGCNYVQDGQPMLADMLHLSPLGAERIAADLASLLPQGTRPGRSPGTSVR